MLDLGLYDRVWLHPRPPVHRLIAECLLRFDYRNVQLVVEGLHNVPARPVVFAMNHTDNFNYWPLQYILHRDLGRYTATWVKGKNYEHWLRDLFMRITNNIPLASRGYVVTRDFLNVLGRRPTESEYKELRDAVDQLRPVDANRVPREILTVERDLLGRRFDPDHESYPEAVDALMHELMARFVAMNERAVALGLSPLVFPQGSRSIRLSRGHIGLAEIALHLDLEIVPIGCNGSDRIYPGSSVRSKPGRVVYRIGEPMKDFADLAPREPFVPFTRAAEERYRPQFQAVVDRVMDRVNGLLDPRHQYADGQISDGSSGTDRFV